MVSEVQKPGLQEAEKSRDFMDASLARKLEVLEKEVTDIKSDIETRTLMHNTLTHELKQGIEARETQIRGFGGWKHGTIYDSKITALEREISDMKKEGRFEELNYWRDISRLKESMRKVLREYWLLQKKKEFLGTYLKKLNKIEW